MHHCYLPSILHFTVLSGLINTFVVRKSNFPIEMYGMEPTFESFAQGWGLGRQCFKGASPSYFGKDNVILTMGDGGGGVT